MAKMYQYAARHSDGFNIWLQGKHMKVKNRVLVLDEAQHKELQDLIATGRHDITAEITYVDPEAAAEIAKRHMAAQPGAAHQGSVHSQANAEKPSLLTQVQGKEPAGMTIKERIAASRQNVLSPGNNEAPLQAITAPLEVIEEAAIHADELAPQAV